MSTHIVEKEFETAPARWQKSLSMLAVAGLTAIALTALTNNARPTTADKLTLLVLGLAGIVFAFSPLRHRVETHRDAATFWITAVMFIIYGLARRAFAGGLEIKLALLPDTPQTVSYVSVTICALALLTAPLWWKGRSSFTGAVLSALAIVAIISLAIFMFLAKFYTVGEVEILDPVPLVETLRQAIEFGALALACCAASALPFSRRVMLQLLPLLLLALWARHTFAAVPLEESE